MRKDLLLRTVLAFLVCLGLTAAASADVKLPAVFGDHMALQCDAPVPVWGWADPAEKVTVSANGQSKTATADSVGKWSVKLDALKAGGPIEITIKGNNTIRLSDVLVGEVWLCSGQSNMAMTVGSSLNAKEEIAVADYPKIRLFTVARKTAEEPQKDCQGQWRACEPKTVGGFSAAGYFFGRELHKQLNVPVGLIDSSWGGTPVEGWTCLKAQEAVPELAPRMEGFKKLLANYSPEKAKQQYEKQMAKWKEDVAKAKTAGKPAPRRPQLFDPHLAPNSPGRLYNGMIAPLAPYGIRGAIWYQGESNAGNALIYGLQMKTMISNWRKIWGAGDFAFLFVQLPNFMAPQKSPSEMSGWPLIREQFVKTLAVPNTGMAVTIDIGEEKDIHPKNKQDVGKRLAQWALAKTYGKDVVACGPLYKSMKQEDGKIVVEFDYAAGRLVSKGDTLKGFAIAGEDKTFVWAEAKIEGDKVVVSSPKVKSPVAVRYAWANNPECNLFNQAGLPASPFRTDDWPQ